MAVMRAEGEFTVASFTPAPVAPAVEVATGVDVGVATMEKRFTGAVEGRSATLFTSAYDQSTGVGTYLAMESFDGTVDGHRGTFNIAHTATTTGGDRVHASLVIVPSSGTGELVGITGSGDVVVEVGGVHRLVLKYALP